MPITLGGLGIRRLQDLSHPAYWSSVHSSIGLSNTILKIQFKCKRQIHRISYRWHTHSRNRRFEEDTKWMGFTKYEGNFWGLLNSSEPIDKARLLASLNNESSKWLHAVPSSQLGLFLNNSSARIAIRLTFGMPDMQKTPVCMWCIGWCERLSRSIMYANWWTFFTSCGHKQNHFTCIVVR